MTETGVRYNVEEQLFNSLDPAPFHEKDLDADAEEYIVGAVDDFPLSEPLKLAIYLPRSVFDRTTGDGIGRAIHNYFAYAGEASGRKLRLTFREGRTTLIIGLAFLAFCFVLRGLVLTLDAGAFRQILAEGLLISGWVAMWRPIQLFLYGWWPERHLLLVFRKLASIPVEVRPGPSA
jgi:hypothetical protein